LIVNKFGEAICGYSDLPVAMCAHCAGKTGSDIPDGVLGIHMPPDAQKQGVDVMKGYVGHTYYPPASKRLTGATEGRTCQCGAPAGNAFICPNCTDELERILDNVPALVEDLDVSAARLDNANPWPVAKPAKRDPESLLNKPVPEWFDHNAEGTDVPIMEDMRRRTLRILGRTRPDNPVAANLLFELTRTLVTAIAVIDPTMPGPFDPLTTGAWLRAHTRGIISHPEAANILRDLTEVHDKALHAIDSAPEQMYYGLCATDLGNGETCGNPVILPVGITTPWRCKCGVEYVLAELEADKIHAARDMLLTVKELASLNGEMPNTVTNRLRRNSIQPVGTRTENGKDVDLYRGGDYIDKWLAKEAAQKK